MDIPSPEDVLAAIQAFLDRHDMKPSRLGSEATGDPNLVAAMRAGRSPSLNVLNRMKAYMERKDQELVVVHDSADTDQACGASSGKPNEVSTEVAA